MWYISIATLIVTQAAWISILLLEHRRRTRLEGEREKTAEALRESESKNRAILEALPDLMFLLDERGTYLDWYANDPRDLYVPPDQFLGKTVHEIMPADVAKSCFAAFGEVLATGVPARVEYSLKKDGETRFFETRIVRCKDRKLLSIARDITDLKRVELELQQMSSQLMNIQDEERLRIARELHDTTAQHLFAITINLENLKRLGGGISPAGMELLNECRSLCERSLQEVRTLAYLRHPPELESSLVSALKWYVEGFRRRTGICVDFQPSSEFARLPIEMEVDLFRVVQEGLFKVFKNAGSRSATIALENNDGHVFLQIKEDAMEMPEIDSHPKEPQNGFAIASLRGRLNRWGGHLNVESNGEGAVLVADIPIRPLTTSEVRT